MKIEEIIEGGVEEIWDETYTGMRGCTKERIREIVSDVVNDAINEAAPPRQ